MYFFNKTVIIIGYIDVGDGRWRPNVMVTTIICWWRFWSFWSPTSTIFLHKCVLPRFKICHQHRHSVTDIHKLSPTSLSPSLFFHKWFRHYFLFLVRAIGLSIICILGLCLAITSKVVQEMDFRLTSWPFRRQIPKSNERQIWSWMHSLLRSLASWRRLSDTFVWC